MSTKKLRKIRFDDNVLISVDVADENMLGGIKIGANETTTQRPVKLDSFNKAYVEIPEGTIYAAGNGLKLTDNVFSVSADYTLSNKFQMQLTDNTNLNLEYDSQLIAACELSTIAPTYIAGTGISINDKTISIDSNEISTQLKLNECARKYTNSSNSDILSSFNVNISDIENPDVNELFFIIKNVVSALGGKISKIN